MTDPISPEGARDGGFAALADPTRRRIIALLAERDRTVNEIAAQFSISRPAISRHLRVLHRSGLVMDERRGRERLQRFDGAALQPVVDWVSRYEGFWRQKLGALKRLVEDDP
jgi:DNA-binding transcriptional ArsR family regulator